MANNNGVVLVHGAWHNRHTWDAVVPLLNEAGCPATAVDLPGAGPHAALPTSFSNRPLDPAAFSTEPSPNAGVTQEERTAAVIAAVRELNGQTGGRAVVVGHSLGGLTVSPVAEAIPDEISAAIYLTAFMLPPGMVAGQMIQDELMAEALVPQLFMADPDDVGALRIDVASDDEAYRALAREAFYADLTDEQFEAALGELHPDEPAQVAGVPSSVTADNFGQVARHYITCEQDRAITIAAQQEMVRLVDEAIGGETTVHPLQSSHSPFHSQPANLAAIITGVAAG